VKWPGVPVSAALADCCKFGSSPEQGVALGGPSGAIQRGQALASARLGRVSRIAYVSGRLGAGKSSLAAPLAAELGYSLVTKDLIKETLHDALFVPGDGEIDKAWSLRLGAASFELLFALAARAGDMVIEANFHPHSELELGKLRGLGDQVVEVHCACPAEVAVARYNARTRHEVHWLKTATLAKMDRYDRPVGIGSLITVDTTGPVDVASVAAEVRRLHASRTG
jgi:predicted kinase